MFGLLFLIALQGDMQLPAPQLTSERYQECRAAVIDNLESGRRLAQQWTAEGGGAPAQHCLAFADAQAGFFKLSAARLEEISDRKDAGDDFVRARLLAQAAELWVQAREFDHADGALNRALNLVPDSGELRLTSARVYAAQEKWQQVIDAVKFAERAGFISADTYILRARGFQAMGNFEASAQDVVRALTLDPLNVDALVLRGELRQTGIEIDVSYGALESAK